MSKYKRGTLDPDYRRKEWRGAHFSPKRSALSISQISLALALIPVAFVLFTNPQFFTVQGLFAAGIMIVVLQVIIAGLLRFLTRRKVVEDHRETYFKKEKPADTPTSTTPSYQDFEHEVAHLFNRLSSYKAVVVGGANDRGIDIKLFRGNRLVGIVQCKQYRADKTLPPGFVRELYGCKLRDNLSVAYLVTTASFSKETKRDAGEMEIKLIDGAKLDQMRQSAKRKQQPTS